jgi:hypothetical protein
MVTLSAMSAPKAEVARASVSRGVGEAREALISHLEGRWTLDGLIDWAERLEAGNPSDPWLAQVARSLANPPLCRELAMAFIGDLLGSTR